MISTERKLYYPMLLILSNSHKKTAEALSKVLKKSGDTTLRILKEDTVDWNDLVTKAKQIFGRNKIEIIIDDSIINKMYSKYIEGSSDNHDPVSKQTFRSMCTVVAMLSNGTKALPVLHKFWVNKEFLSPEDYKTKVEIAQELITLLKDKIDIKIILMDGLYATSQMIKWCKDNNLPCEMRLHSNRRVSLDHANSDVTVKINACEELKLRGKKSCRTVKAFWHGELVYITSVKRLRKDDSFIIVYQISTVKMPAHKHVRAYQHRWPIEKFFRTSKQHLGLADCQSRKKSLQEKHIYNVFLAYMILQLERQKAKFKNPEQALHSIKRKQNMPLHFHIKRVDKIFQNNEALYA